jgi:2-haloacid dehalogenase
VLARAQHRFFDLFDGIVVSGEEGLIKPDPRIFRLFLDRYGVMAEDCIFITTMKPISQRRIDLGCQSFITLRGSTWQRRLKS